MIEMIWGFGRFGRFVGAAGVAGVVGVAVVAGVVGLVGVELFASFEHVRPQYGWTLVPSLNFGFCLQCYENRSDDDRVVTPAENHLAESRLRIRIRLSLSGASCLARTCPRTVVEVLTCSGVKCYRAGFAILRRHDTVSHATENRSHGGLTGQRPAGVADFEDFVFESPNKFFHFMVQGVEGLVFGGAESVVVSVRGAEV